MAGSAHTVLIVPGLRDHVPDHWQTVLADRLPRAASVPPSGRGDLDIRRRTEAIDAAVAAIAGPVILVAHSAGAVMVAHWATQWAARPRRQVMGALLAAPPDIETVMPDGYPTLPQLREAGWLPVPRARLPFPAIVAASRNDPLARYARVEALARDWGARLVDLGEVGHLNPASGFGPWPRAETLIGELAGVEAAAS